MRLAAAPWMITCAVALALLGSAPASAETISYCDSFPRDTIRPITLNIPAFDLPGCTLIGASVTLNLLVDGQFFGENTGNCLPEGCTEYDSIGVALAFSDLDGTPEASEWSFISTVVLTSFDGEFDFGGTSGYTTPWSWPAYADHVVPFADLAQFLSPQTLPVLTEAHWMRVGPGNGSFNVSTYLTAELCVTYTYECPSAAEPTTWTRAKTLYR